MKILHMQQNASSNREKCMCCTWLNMNLNSADDSQNWDMVKFPRNDIDGFKKNNNKFHISP